MCSLSLRKARGLQLAGAVIVTQKYLAKLALTVAFALGAPMLGCSSQPHGANDAALAQARSRASNGALVYQSQCADCHGERGEGLAGTPPVMGADALPVYPKEAELARQYASDERTPVESHRSLLNSSTRGAFKTARDLGDFVGAHMPRIRKTPAPLTAEQNWTVVSYLLVANGTEIPASGVDASNADRVPLHR